MVVFCQIEPYGNFDLTPVNIALRMGAELHRAPDSSNVGQHPFWLFVSDPAHEHKIKHAIKCHYDAIQALNPPPSYRGLHDSKNSVIKEMLSHQNMHEMRKMLGLI